MRKVIHYVAASLDGCIARADGSVDWLPVPSGKRDRGYAAFLRGIGTLVVGRKSYEQMLGCGAWPYGRRDCYVLSRRWAGERDAQARFVGGDIPALLRRLKRRPGRDIWLVGGSDSAQVCFAAGLVDEVVLTVVPTLLGGGIPLFAPGGRTQRLRLRSCRTFRGGCVQLRYALAP